MKKRNVPIFPPARRIMEPQGQSLRYIPLRPWGGIPSEPTARGRGARRGITLGIALAALAWSGHAPQAWATDYTWKGATGSWSDASQWTPNGVPGASDNATINSGTATATGTISVANLSIGAGASLSATGLGYAGGSSAYTAGTGGGDGGGGGGCWYCGGGGGGHGGAGGTGATGSGAYSYSSQSGAPGGAAGTATALQPTIAGAGGGGAVGAGGAGGGAIKLVVSGTLTVNGTIQANGKAAGAAAGGGAGGAIWVEAGTVTGSAAVPFQTTGGTGGNGNNNGYAYGAMGCGGGGGGGRIAVHYWANSLIYPNGASVAGGGGGGACGYFGGSGASQAGTINYIDISKPTVTSITGQNPQTTAGGKSITLNGAYFDPTDRVSVGGTDIDVAFVSRSELRATAPAKPAGSYDVVLKGIFGDTATCASCMTYIAPPTISSVTPSTGLSTAGGQTVTITGAGLKVGASGVKMDALVTNLTKEDGTISGGAVFEAGRIGKGLKLDGTGFAQIYPLPLTATDTFGLELWFYPTKPSATQDLLWIGATANPPLRGYGIRVNASNTLSFAYVYSNGGTATLASLGAIAASSSQWGFNRWNHVAVSRSAGGPVTMYVNGIPNALGAPLGAILPAVSPPDVMWIGGSDVTKFTGTIDEVAVYGQALSAQSVAAHYAQAQEQYLGLQMRTGPCATPDDAACVASWTEWKPRSAMSQETPGLKLLWRLDEAGGQTLTDTLSSGSGTNGVANNGQLGAFTTDTAGDPARSAGVFGSALAFNGADQFARLDSAATNPLMGASDGWTLQAWVSPTTAKAATLLYIGNPTSVPPTGMGLSQGSSATATDNMISVRYGGSFFSTGQTYDLNAWNHITVTRAGGYVRVYKNGAQIGLDADGDGVIDDLDGVTNPTAPVTADPVWLGGVGGVAGSFFAGTLDEPALYNIPLGAVAIQQQALGTGLTAPTTALDTLLMQNSYAQFRALMSSETPTISPKLFFVQVQTQGAYPADSPSITLVNAAQAPKFTTLQNFSDTKGSLNQGSVKYRLSPDAATWYFYNAAATPPQWQATGTSHTQATPCNGQAADQCNDASQMSANLAGFIAQVVPGMVQAGQAPQLYWKAFLITDGAKQVSLDQVHVDADYSTIALSAPAGGTVLRIGNPVTIAWAHEGRAYPVTIEYDPDGDFSAEPNNTKLISAAATNGQNTGCTVTNSATQGCFVWTVPPEIAYTSVAGKAGKIRLTLSDAAPAAGSISVSGELTITPPVITISEPHASEAIKVNTTKRILWTSDGAPISNNLTIEYSTDHFATTGPVAAGVFNGANSCAVPSGSTGCYDWAVLANLPLSSNYQIRIRDTAAPKAQADSGTFTVAGTITPVNPKAGVKWAVEAPHTISWQYQGAIPKVRLELSKDGASFAPIIASTPNLGGYSWTPTAADATATATIRVAKDDDPDTNGVSSAFRLTALQITRPSGNRFTVGANEAITWSQTGFDPAADRITLEYSLNDFQTSALIAPSVSVNAGTYSWTVPDAIKKDGLKIRITDIAPSTGDAATQAVSAAFTINGALALTAPLGNEIWDSGAKHTITWKTLAGTIPNVRVEVSTDGGTSYDDIAASAVNGANSGCAVPVGSSGCLDWTPSFTSRVVKIRISDPRDPQTKSVSGMFEVPGFSMVQPDGAVPLPVGTGMVIQWNYVGSTVANVQLEYSRDQFQADVQPIMASATNGANGCLLPNINVTGCFPWTVPDAISKTVAIRLKALDNPLTAGDESTLSAVSQGLVIQGVLHMLSPNDSTYTYTVGEQLAASDPKTIRWQTTGTMPAVKLQLSADGTWTNPIDLATLTNNLGGGLSPIANSVAWTVPDQIATKAKVRIVDNDPAHPASSDDSDSTFSIKSTFGFSGLPSSTDLGWVVNEEHPVSWTSVGTVQQVKLEVSTDGASWQPLQDQFGAFPTQLGNANGTTWKVQDLVSPLVPAGQLGDGAAIDAHRVKTVRLRISDADPAHPVSQVTSGLFAVRWLRMKWVVNNGDTNAPLGELNVDQPAALQSPAWKVTNADCPACLNSPIYRHYPLGAYVSTWSRKDFSPATITGWVAQRDDGPGGTAGSDVGGMWDKVLPVFLVSTVPDPTVYQVRVETHYESTTDTLSATAWLEKQGSLPFNLARLGNATFALYDGNSLMKSLTQTVPIINGAPDPNWPGNYAFVLTPSKLVPGKIYFAKASVIYDGLSRTSGGIVNITIPKQIQEIAAATAAGFDTGLGATLEQVSKDTDEIKKATVGPDSTLERVSAAVTTVLPAQITQAQAAIQSDAAAAKTELSSQISGVQETATQIKADTQAIRPIVEDIGPKVTAILSDPNAGLPKLLSNQETMQQSLKAQHKGKILNRETTVELGESVTIHYMPGDPATVPMIQINGPSFSVGPMSMAPDGSGLYRFAQMFDESLTEGEYSVVVAEGPSASGVSDGTVDTLTLKLRAPVATAQAVGDVVTQLTDLGTKVSELGTNLDGLIQTAAQIQAAADAATATADQLALDTADLRAKWGTLDAARLMAEITNLSAQIGAPAQAASVQTALTMLSSIQADMAKDATVAKSADLQAKYDGLTTQMNSLKAILGTLSGTQGATMDSVMAEFAQVEALIKTLPSAQAQDPSEQLAAITDQLAQLSSDLTALGAAPAQDNNVGALAAQLTTIQSTLNDVQGHQVEPDTLLDQLAALQQSVKSAEGGGAAVSASERAYAAANEALNLLRRLQAEAEAKSTSSTEIPSLLGQLNEKLASISKVVSTVPSGITPAQLEAQLKAVVEEAKAVATQKGYHFDSLYEMAQTQEKDVHTMRNRVEELKALLDVQRTILEQKLNQPVVKSWFEAGY